MSWLNRALWTGCVFLLGYLSCMVFLRIETVGAPLSIVRAPYRTPTVPAVEIREINRGSIVGSIGTGARLVLAGTVVIPDPAGAFSVEAAPFLHNIIDIAVPPDAQYVASSKGTKYYPVSSKQWLQWKTEPLFFASEREALAAGYEKAK